MSSMNRADNFSGRVNYAASVISSGRPTTRSFDNCFENDDGSAVAVALWRRAQKNPRLAENMPRYLTTELVLRDVEELKDIPTNKLGEIAAEMRAKAKAKFDAIMAHRKAEKEAKKQACIDAGYTIENFPEIHRWTAYRPDGSVISRDCVWEDNAWYVCECDMKKMGDLNHA